MTKRMIQAMLAVVILTACAPAPTPVTHAPLTAQQRCHLALVAEHARWRINPDVVNAPSECHQPTVTYDEYSAAWDAIGQGIEWTDVAPITYQQH